MTTNFYISDNMMTVSPDDLSRGVMIFCIVSDDIIFRFDKADGPFASLEQLRKQSFIFKKLTKTDTNRAQKILEEKNIKYIKNLVPVPKGQSYPVDYIKLLDHTIRGKIKSQKIYGIHFFDSTRMKIKMILDSEDKYLVWRAIVEVFDIKTKVWHEKESTFFPKNWTLSQLFYECDYAYSNKIKDDKAENIYKSKTFSGVPVEIIIKDGKVKSIYPIYNK